MSESSHESKLISVEALEHGHTLSFDQQPYFADLIGAIRGKGVVTLVVGAGASIEAGLPTWHQLLERIAEQIPDPEIRAVMKDDAADPLRKAESLQALIVRNHAETTEGMIRKGLYGTLDDFRPGEIYQALGRLVAIDPKRFRIVTTNFDPLIEAALDDLGIPTRGVALNEYLADDYTPSDEACEVLYLHGRIAPQSHPGLLEPIVLTESQFLRHGPNVRDALRRAMRSATAVVFVGVSLTDPNLVAPLWEIATGEAGQDAADRSVPKFAFSVLTDPRRGLDDGVATSPQTAAKIERLKATYLEKELGARPILMRSFSQLVQALSELGLCAWEPSRYLRKPRSGTSIRYGRRFGAALDLAYKNIGAPRGSDFPADAEGLSKGLHDVLYERGGLVSLIDEAMHTHCGRDRDESERFALFLWLRSRTHTQLKAPYQVHLVGSSAYAHREDWSLNRPDAISFSSKYAASRCLFVGGLQQQNLELQHESPPTWRGIIARPLICYGFEVSEVLQTRESLAYADRLTLGAVTLNSTRTVTAEEGGAEGNLSALAELRSRGRIAPIVSELNARVVEKVLRLR